MYKCYLCKRQFVGGERLIAEKIWEAYSLGKQTYVQLSKQYGCSTKTIQRKIDSVEIQQEKIFDPVVNAIIDTTYFGRTFGVMVFKDSLSGKFLFKKYVKYETNELYYSGIEEIGRRGICIQSIICDGRKGLLTLFKGIPIQMCQFHQIQIVLRYLTKHPKLESSQELRLISLKLVSCSKIEFIKKLDNWAIKWADCLNERTISNVTGKSFYTHKRLRSAYLSLRRNMQWLFTFEQYPEFKIPNTTNALDGSFSDLKNKLRNHNGLSLERKKRFIDGFFKV